MQGQAEADQQQEELPRFDPAGERQPPDQQEDHGLEGPDLGHLEVRGEPLDDQALLLGAAASLEGIEVDVPAIGIDDGDRDRSGEDGRHSPQARQRHHPGTPQQEARPFHQQRDPEDRVAEHEAGVEIDPEQHDGGQQVERAAAALAKPLDPQVGQRAQREGDHLDARAPDGIGGRHPEGQRQPGDHEVHAPVDRPIDEEEAGGGDGSEDEAHQR